MPSEELKAEKQNTMSRMHIPSELDRAVPWFDHRWTNVTMKPSLFGLSQVIDYHDYRKARSLTGELAVTNRWNLCCRHCRVSDPVASESSLGSGLILSVTADHCLKATFPGFAYLATSWVVEG